MVETRWYRGTFGKGHDAGQESSSCKQSPVNELINIFDKRRLIEANAPLGSRESNRSLSYITHIAKANTGGEEDGKCNEAREPKDHHQTVGTKQGVSRRSAREFHRHYSDVDKRKNGPDAVEDQEVDFRWRHLMPIARPPVGN